MFRLLLLVLLLVSSSTVLAKECPQQAPSLASAAIQVEKGLNGLEKITQYMKVLDQRRIKHILLIKEMAKVILEVGGIYVYDISKTSSTTMVSGVMKTSHSIKLVIGDDVGPLLELNVDGYHRWVQTYLALEEFELHDGKLVRRKYLCVLLDKTANIHAEHQVSSYLMFRPTEEFIPAEKQE